ncbi:hypothetical protein [Bacteroides gallinarum]|uniref:hypothetical protein n=1 Tax=Bacteroides gallinarum TaxID=376806 RepID=UPI00036E91E7|nr:hypothetical protein [Bacteroides gallinarum]
MKTIVKAFWLSLLLILTCSISGKAVDFTGAGIKLAETYKDSVALLSCSPTSFEQKKSKFADTRYSTADMELDTKSVTEIYTFGQQRMRRVAEDNNILLRNIFIILSNYESLLVHGRTKRFFSDKAPYYAVTGNDYCIYVLRRILI